MIESLSRPFRPVELGSRELHFFQLHGLGEDLRNEGEYQRNGVSAVTLARDSHMTVLLVALRKGAVMREHKAPSAGTAVFLAGRAHFVIGTGADAERTPMGPGTVAAFSADLPHAVEGEEDSLYLVTIGGRDRPR